MITRFLKLFSLAITSWPGLFVMNCLLLGISARLAVQIVLHYQGGMLAESENVLSLMESVPIRLITVGVVILEREDILEMLGARDSLDQHDSLYELSQPYGMYYLCGGLIMECFVDAFKHPFLLIDIFTQKAYTVALIMLFSIVSLVVSLNYAVKLIAWRRCTRRQNN